MALLLDAARRLRFSLARLFAVLTIVCALLAARSWLAQHMECDEPPAARLEQLGGYYDWPLTNRAIQE